MLACLLAYLLTSAFSFFYLLTTRFLLVSAPTSLLGAHDCAGWNKVFIPIGDRTAFTGDRWGGKPLFRGRRNLDATLADLLLRYNMSAAADVVLTGGSSGGHATYLQCDRVGGIVGAGAPGARFACLADAGFFLFHDTATPGVPAATNEEFAESFYAWNSSAAVNAGCLAHYAPLGTPEKCIFAQHVLPFIKSRLFVMQNLYDRYVPSSLAREEEEEEEPARGCAPFRRRRRRRCRRSPPPRLYLAACR